MSGRDDTLDLTLEIDEKGEIKVTSRAVLRRLSAVAGRYRLLPSVGDLLLLQRDDETATLSSAAVAMCGEIDGPGALANILNFIHFSQLDGTLAAVSGATRKSMFFRRGQVLAATSNLPEDRIGAQLVRFGKLREEALGECVREVTPAKRLGAILVERGHITSAALYDAVRRQAEEIFFSTLLIQRGSFYLLKKVDEAALPARLHLDTQSLLLEGLRRIDEMSFFRAKLPSMAVVLKRRDPPPAAPPDGDALSVYASLDAPRTLGDVARVTHLGEFAATKAAFELVQTNYIEAQSQPEIARSRSVKGISIPADAMALIIDAYNEAFGRLYGTMSGKGKAAALRQGVRAFMSSSVRFAELFRDVVLAEDGTLPRRQLLLNIDGLPDGERLELLQRGLNELLFFVLFVAGDAIDRAEEQELHARVARALEGLPRVDRAEAAG
jgi:hypothetical protein